MGLLEILEDADFLYRVRTRDEVVNSKVMNRKIVQIIFLYKDSIKYGQRFIANKVLIIDGTFNINSLRMPLLMVTRIMNYALKGRSKLATFPLTFSYCLGEGAESYAFLFKTLNEEVFCNSVKPPGIVMGD